jgi:hypothetical protein
VDDLTARAWDAEYAAGTDVHPAHEVTERDADGSYSVRYLAGPKAGMSVHFWAARELDSALAAAGLAPVLALRPQATWPAQRAQGLWLQREGIYRRAPRLRTRRPRSSAILP